MRAVAHWPPSGLQLAQRGSVIVSSNSPRHALLLKSQNAIALRSRCPSVAVRCFGGEGRGSSAGGGRGGGGRGGRGGGRGRGKRPMRPASDGVEHLGSALTTLMERPFPGPPSDDGPPLRILPIGGLGEIGMNCMLVGAKDRYVLIDAGLMFPDFSDLGMQKILPDTSFLHAWRDKIEAVIITHGHEDHIGALPWVIPALDPSTPVYAGSFVMRLIQRRLVDFTMFRPEQFRQFEMKEKFQAGPFEVEPIRVTHSIPDCCGLVLRSEFGTIVHTGDWKIDETPSDGNIFDRTTFDMLGKENVTLMMSDSTNVLAPGRTSSERVVEDALTQKVLAHHGKGRVVVTQFASNIHRMGSVFKAAQASGRKICFVGMSLGTYLEAAEKDGRAPFPTTSLIQVEDLDTYNPNEVLIITTGSQAEPRAQLSLASRGASKLIKIRADDLMLYSAKCIPGNEGRVTRMLNSIALQGARVVAGRGDNLHVSGHAYQEELLEVIRLVKPQTFLPVHGEYSFLCEHARLAKEEAGVNYTEVIKNGTLLGVGERTNKNSVSSGNAQILGEAKLVNFYNDGGRGTGDQNEMAIAERTNLAFEGVVVVALDVSRSQDGISASCRLTTRGMWTDAGRLLSKLQESVEKAVMRMQVVATLTGIEREVISVVLRECRQFNNRKPEVIVIAHENDPSKDLSAYSTLENSSQISAASLYPEKSREWNGENPNRPRPNGRDNAQGGRGQPGGQGGVNTGAGRGFGAGRSPSASTANEAAEAAAGSKLSAMMNSRKEVVQAKTMADKAKLKASAEASAEARAAGVGGGPLGGAKLLPEGVLAERRRMNPRDQPASEENDTDFG